MISFYKFKMLIAYQDELENEDPYYPEGVVSSLNYDQLIYQGKIMIMWKSPKGVAYECSIDLSDIEMEKCSEKEYKALSDEIDYINNNNLSRLFDEEFEIEESSSATFSIVK